jgi:hypothetical protein
LEGTGALYRAEKPVSVYDPYERLVPVDLLGRTIQVPENNTLLRCFQYLCPDSVAQGRFCWNNDCGHCELSYRLPGSVEERKTRGCQSRVCEGMEITKISIYLRVALVPLLEAPTAPRSTSVA